MRYFSFVDKKTSDATLSLVYHNLPNDKIKIYTTAEGKVCSVDGTDDEILGWLDAQVVEMTDIDAAAFTAKRAQSEQWKLEFAWLQKQAKQYLDDTDWYYIRKIDVGIEVPADVAAKRLECREFLNA